MHQPSKSLQYVTRQSVLLSIISFFRTCNTWCLLSFLSVPQHTLNQGHVSQVALWSNGQHSRLSLQSPQVQISVKSTLFVLSFKNIIIKKTLLLLILLSGNTDVIKNVHAFFLLSLCVYVSLCPHPHH